MIKSFTILVLFVGLLAACHKKAIPEITERKADAPRIIKFDYPPKETVAPDTVIGKRVFTNRCSRCHALPLPNQFTAKMWDPILEVMFARARFTNEEGLHVRTWILANSQ